MNFDGGAGETPALLWSGDRIVVTTAMRASAGTRFNAMLHPTQPARRAVGASGFRLMMADGRNAKLGTSRRLWTRSRPLARPSRAFTFGRIPFAGGLHRSRSVGLTAFAVGKSFSPFPKWLKSRTAQVNPPRGEFVLHEIEVRRPVVLNGVDLVFVFTSAP
jgi:hypothetical protein